MPVEPGGAEKHDAPWAPDGLQFKKFFTSPDLNDNSKAP